MQYIWHHQRMSLIDHFTSAISCCCLSLSWFSLSEIFHHLSRVHSIEPHWHMVFGCFNELFNQINGRKNLHNMHTLRSYNYADSWLIQCYNELCCVELGAHRSCLQKNKIYIKKFCVHIHGIGIGIASYVSMQRGDNMIDS